MKLGTKPSKLRMQKFLNRGFIYSFDQIHVTQSDPLHSWNICDRGDGSDSIHDLRNELLKIGVRGGVIHEGSVVQYVTRAVIRSLKAPAGFRSHGNGLASINNLYAGSLLFREFLIG